jgi:chaperonin GroES
MTIKPLSNHVLIEPLAEEEKMTKSGIVLPDTIEKKKQSMGVVVSIGPGKMTGEGKLIPMSVRAGQKVLFKEPWSEESKIKDGDKKFLLVEEEDILAVIE